MSGFMTYAIKMTTQNMQWPFWALDTTPLKVPTHIIVRFVPLVIDHNPGYKS